MMRRIDLLPSAYQERRRQRRNIGFIVIAGMLVMLLMIGWWLLLGAQVNGEKDDLADAQARNAQLESEISALQRFAELDAEVTAKRTALQTVMAGDVDWPALMTEVAMVIPGEAWLTTMSSSAGQTEGASPVATENAPIRISDEVPFGRISFQGNALSMPGVAKWLIRLQTVKAFGAIWLNNASASVTEGAPTIVTFDSTLELNDRAASRRFQDGVDE